MTEPSQTDIAAMQGTVLLEFGAAWCGYCKAAQSLIVEALARHPEIRHIKIEDGKGRRLGRLYRVKLWPTLVLLKNGAEVGRVVRPEDADGVSALLRG